MSTQFRLGDGVSRDAVWEVCAGAGLRLSNVVAHAASHPAQAIFVSPDRRTMVHLIEDEAAGRAVVTRGERAEEITAELLRALDEGGPAATSEAVANAAAASENPSIEGIR